MRKGLLAIVTIALLFSIVGCSDETVNVKSLSLTKPAYSVSTANLKPEYVNAKDILPLNATNKQVTYELVDAVIDTGAVE